MYLLYWDKTFIIFTFFYIMKSMYWGCLIKLLISAILGVFAVVLIGKALHGDPIAIGLAVTEFLIIAYPYWAAEKKVIPWLDKTHLYGTILWFVTAITWVLYVLFF